MRTNNNNLVDFSSKNTYIEPNFLDYSEIDLNEYLQKTGI